MGTKIKGIYKGFKYISQIFVVNTKEDEIEIGYPTDVKHVAHIGWDSPSGTAPSWMNEFKTASDYAATSIGNINETRCSTRSPQVTEVESVDQEPKTGCFKEEPTTDPPKAQKKHRKKKNKASNSPKSSSSSRSSRPAKPKSKFSEESAKPANIKVT